MKKFYSLSLIILLIFSMFITVFLGNVTAVDDDHNLSGIVWKSDGTPPSQATEFCIWVEHPANSGLWSRFPDTGWAYTEQGVDGNWWYSYVLPDESHTIQWDHDAIYRVQVNGTPWSDFNGNATSNGTGSAGDPFPPYDPQNDDYKSNTINYSAGGGIENEQQWDVQTVAMIDIAPTNVTAYGEIPSNHPFGIPVPPDTSIDIIFNVTNSGSTASGDFNVTLWECTSTAQNLGSTAISEFRVTSLAGGADTGIFTVNWLTPTSPGDYFINITVDSNGEVSEFDKSNNIFLFNSEPLHFKIGPDLIYINLLVDGAVPSGIIYVPPLWGVQIEAAAMNVGYSSTGVQTKMAIYNITGSGGSIIPGSEVERDILILNPGETSPTQNWIWTSPWLTGDFYVNVSVDFLNDTHEANEDNNNFTIHFNVPNEPWTFADADMPRFPDDPSWLYVNSSTEIDLVPGGFNPPWFTWYRIINVPTGTIVKNWSNYTAEGTTFTMSWGEGLFSIEFNSTDSVGASEATKNKTVIVDNSPPSSTITIGPLKYRDGISDIWNITSATNISLGAVDHPQGVNIIGLNSSSGMADPDVVDSGIFYRIEELSTGLDVQGWQEYVPGSQFYLDDPSLTDGYYRLWVNSTDNLLQSEIKFEDIYLDNTGPDSNITSDSTIERPGNIWEITEPSQFTISADDGQGSGVVYIWYRFDDEDWMRMLWSAYPGPTNLTGLFAGLSSEDITWNHTLWIRGLDNLGNNGTLNSLLIYVEGDLAPPKPPLLKLMVDGDDIMLYWEPSDDLDVNHYLIYRSATKTGFDFNDVWVNTQTDMETGETSSLPLRTSWNDTGAARSEGGKEFYYTLRAVDELDNTGTTSNIAGKVTLTFKDGYNTFALPLEPFTGITASQMLSGDMFTQETDTIYRYDSDIQQWIGHPKYLPTYMDDFELEMGKGYMVFISEDIVEYTFTGAAGTAIKYMEGILNDTEFRNSLTASVQEDQVRLSWANVTGATGYNIYRASVRYGEGSLTDYINNTVPIAQNNANELEYTDIQATGDEYYYLVCAETNGVEMACAYAIGMQQFTISQGYSSFSFVLESKTQETVGSFANNKFTSDTDTLYYYLSQNGDWQGHPKLLPENINTGNVVTGVAYMIFTDNESIRFAVIGV